MLNEHRHLNIIRLEPAPMARSKSMEIRAEARKRALAEYFQDAREVGVRTQDLILQRRDRRDHGEMLNRLCGVIDSQGICQGLAVIESVSRKWMGLSTPVPAEKMRLLQLGDLWVSSIADTREWAILNSPDFGPR